MTTVGGSVSRRCPGVLSASAQRPRAAFSGLGAFIVSLEIGYFPSDFVFLDQGFLAFLKSLVFPNKFQNLSIPPTQALEENPCRDSHWGFTESIR